jgi:hypothetical protein
MVLTNAPTPAPTNQALSFAKPAVTPATAPAIPPARNMGNAQQAAHATIMASAPTIPRFPLCMGPCCDLKYTRGQAFPKARHAHW